MLLSLANSYRLSVAPMMDWTDRHCRYLHRLISKHALLYTEMISSAALVQGGATWLLESHPSEHPVALQLGGSDPDELAEATRMGVEAGFDEINFNAGCPSDRVQEGCFGAILMKKPDLVYRCLASMKRAAQGVEVTVKCRIGVDDQQPEIVLPEFLQVLSDAGIARVAIHARKAWLSGLSPKQNRNVPPLNHGLVLSMKDEFPEMRICLNGGIADLDSAERYLKAGMDGVMMGRAAYRGPFQVLGQVDRRIFGAGSEATRVGVAQEMLDYIEDELAQGTKINQVTRHMIGLFAGCRGARAWRQALSDHRRLAEDGIGYLSNVVAGMTEYQHMPVDLPSIPDTRVTEMQSSR